jgi:hypothetical protein
MLARVGLFRLLRYFFAPVIVSAEVHPTWCLPGLEPPGSNRCHKRGSRIVPHPRGRRDAHLRSMDRSGSTPGLEVRIRGPLSTTLIYPESSVTRGTPSKTFARKCPTSSQLVPGIVQGRISEAATGSRLSASGFIPQFSWQLFSGRAYRRLNVRVVSPARFSR